MVEKNEGITLEEVKKRRNVVEDTIYALLCDFEANTGCVITDIHIERTVVDIASPDVSVKMLSGISTDVILV